MKQIKIKDIINLCEGKLLTGSEEETIENFKKDTREIEEGDTYVGIKGEKIDGSKLYEKAFESGAKVCIINKIEMPEENLKKYQDKAILEVEDTIKALQQIATYKREQYDIPVVGITGSVGKTSTKDLTASVLSKKYNTLKTNGNYNNHIGVPLTVLGLKDHTAAVIEMGMSNLGEISTLTKIAKPTMSVITNIRNSTYRRLRFKRKYTKSKARNTRRNGRRCTDHHK